MSVWSGLFGCGRVGLGYAVWGLVFLVVLSAPSVLWAWGRTGHRVVGEIGQRNLSANAKKKVNTLLKGLPLSEAAVWPDFMKSYPQWDFMRPWHYININSSINFSGAPRFPKPNPKKPKNVLDGIEFAVGILKGTVTHHKIKKPEAIKLLAHFVGDIHMPLHVGYKEDQGARFYKVSWFGKKTNLHSVWDEDLVNWMELSFTEWADLLEATQKAPKNLGNATDWARESVGYHQLAYTFANRQLNGNLPPFKPAEFFKKWSRRKKRVQHKLGYYYRDRVDTALKSRFFLAGRRLADTLNKALR